MKSFRGFSQLLLLSALTTTLFAACTKKQEAASETPPPSVPSTPETCGISTDCSDPNQVTVSTMNLTVSGDSIGDDGTNLYVGGLTLTKIDPSTQSATLIAGGPFGYANGVGTNARFKGISGITSDGTSLYLVDRYSNTIRKMEISSSTVTLLAGIPNTAGFADSSGNPAASFDQPNTIVYLGGALFLASWANFNIRWLKPLGYTTTIAGSPTGVRGTIDGRGTASRFDDPSGITGVGNYVYVSEMSRHTIRRITAPNQRVTTYAGVVDVSGQNDGNLSEARFHCPISLTNDGARLFVVDYCSRLIRKIVLSTGQVSTLAGSTTAGMTDGKGGVASFVEPISITYLKGALYVLDQDKIRVIQ